ncbi:tetratricopeptide repeat protein [Brevibacillus daliensis]|uniref:tetratricopeptide repeat protein n=1 Tax=Brevibacillus daliensis TaxID=2892995 RepID=UPI001E540DBD|nr:tetratricopeptide repeat protein [Brevibacillus daliensis]
MEKVHIELEHAIKLREEKNLLTSNEILVTLVKEFPENAIVSYQCAWSYDVLGKEREAVPYYEKALSLGLEGEDLEGALLGLGSTYRTLGEYEKSKNILLKGVELFPANHSIKVFYAMTLYNLGEHNKAMDILLTSLVKTSDDPEIIKYKNAIQFYSNKLDTIWE